MGDLTLNKIFGSLLAVALVFFGLRALSDMVFADSGGGHHGGEHGEDISYSEKLKQQYAYYVAVEGGAAGGGAEEEEVFDLGLALANADLSRGERSFKAKCATCHTVEQGGANGTGPNLYGVVGADIAAHDGFSYSGVLSGKEGEWTYAEMSDWLYNPSSYARGTSMAFAGLRRDDERANVIAYLASYSPEAPDFPDPLPEEPAEDEGEAGTDGGEAPEGSEAPEAGEAVEATLPEAGMEAADPMKATGEIEVEDAVDGVGVNDGDVGEVESIAGTTAEEIEDAAGEAAEAASDRVEEAQDAAGEAMDEASQSNPDE
ncbi:MAG: c-type cytochrome [Alphaproteobacteria bacterium]|jgi:cytochrome c|nr:c-type cytochrome [Alphaproteobacteria bacterium]